MTSSRTPDPAERSSSADAERVPALRVALWMAVAVVLATGVVLYFRHQDDVTPVLGVSADGGRR